MFIVSYSQKVTFRKLDLFPSSGEKMGRHVSSWVRWKVNLNHLSYFRFPNDQFFGDIQRWTKFRNSLIPPVVCMCHSSNPIMLTNIYKPLRSPKANYLVHNSKLLLHTTSQMNPYHQLLVHTETSSSSSSSSTFSTSLLLCLVPHSSASCVFTYSPGGSTSAHS
jgi:hypothetical protein